MAAEIGPEVDGEREHELGTVPTTVPGVLRSSADRHGDLEAVVDGPHRLTYAELLVEV